MEKSSAARDYNDDLDDDNDDNNTTTTTMTTTTTATTTTTTMTTTTTTTIIIIITPVECASKSDTSNNKGDWNYFKITQTITEQLSGKALN